MMRSRCRIARCGASWCAALVGLAACGSPPPAEHVEEDNSFNVTIDVNGGRRAAPASIDLDDPRIAAARRELAALLGHALDVEVDAGAAASFGRRLHEAYITALEEAATALDECRQNQPDAFAFGSPELVRVRVEYHPVRSATYTPPNLHEGTFRVPLYPDSVELFDGSSLCSAFEGKLSAARQRQFTGVEPSRVAARDHAAYVAYLDARGDAVLVLLETIRLMAELEPRLTAPELREKVTRSLSQHGSTLARLYRAKSADARVLTALGKAQRAWIAWVNRRGSSLDEDSLRNVIDTLFLDEGQHATARELRHGFDSTAFGAPIIDDFVAHVATEDTTRTEDRSWMFVVCRARPNEYHRGLEVSKKCNGAFYGDLVKTPAGRQKLSALLLAKHDDVLTQTAIVHSLRVQGTEPVLALVESLRHDEKTLRVALRALADFSGWRSPGTAEHPDPVHPRALIQRVPGWWQSMPAQRAALLHVLFGTSGVGKERLPWPKLPEFLGARIDRETLSAYLASSWRALDDLPRLMPSLSLGWPRSRVIVPALERWLDAQAAGRLGDANPSHAATSAADALCQSGVTTDFDDMQHALRERAERYPSQMQRLAPFYEDSRTQVCPYVSPKEPSEKAPTERVSFGD